MPEHVFEILALRFVLNGVYASLLSPVACFYTRDSRLKKKSFIYISLSAAVRLSPKDSRFLRLVNGFSFVKSYKQ
jgi:hypothetical protein